jgi:DUF4097 and DUF4098 domain-containing protein YvlB
MRRAVLVVTTLLVAAVLGVQAQAGPIIPMHQQTVTEDVHGSVRSVTVTGDYSSVKVLTGTSTRVRAQESWNFQQPKLTVSLNRGVLKVEISCTDSTTVGGVVFVGSGDLVNDCTDDLTVTVPSAASLAVTSSGAITSTGRHAAQRLHSYGAGVTVAHSIGSVDASSDSGNVTGSDLHGVQVSLRSGQGSVEARGLRATELSLSSDAGDVSADSVVVGNLSAHSGQGALAITDTTARSMMLSTDSGDITLQRLHLGSLQASTGQGIVRSSHLSAATASLRSSSGDVTVNDANSSTLELSSGQGTLTTTGLRVTHLTATTDAGNIHAVTTNAPNEMLLHSGQGTVLGDVATGTYAVTASSGQGKVTITGLRVDSGADHHIDAHSDSGDVTIQGH